jgi:hypothetical protein
MNLADLHHQFQQLQQRHNLLEAELNWFKQIFKSLVGVSGPWLSPVKAGMLLGASRDRIMGEIRRAEQMRASGKSWDVVYGVHYRTIQDLDSEAPTWQVNVMALEAVLNYPPDQRPILNSERKVN